MVVQIIHPDDGTGVSRSKENLDKMQGVYGVVYDGM
jgi:hypothetical protein